MKIGIIDSGLGGLTVLKECLKQLPEHTYLYYADSDNAPYGAKSKEAVYKLTKAAVDFLVEKEADIIVIACNTATSAAATLLRQSYDLPIIGMEPALKPALLLAKNRRVLVTATHLTLQEQKFCDLITSLDACGLTDCVGLTDLVTFAESGIFSRDVVLPFLMTAFADFDLSVYGSVVLGCTHFPLFREYFEEIFPAGVVIVDGAVGTVNRIKEFVTCVSDAPSVTFFVSGLPLADEVLMNRIQDILGREAI